MVSMGSNMRLDADGINEYLNRMDKTKHCTDFTPAQMRWLRIEAAKAACSVGEYIRRLVDAARMA